MFILNCFLEKVQTKTQASEPEVSLVTSPLPCVPLFCLSGLCKLVLTACTMAYAFHRLIFRNDLDTPDLNFH